MTLNANVYIATRAAGVGGVYAPLARSRAELRDTRKGGVGTYTRGNVARFVLGVTINRYGVQKGESCPED